MSPLTPWRDEIRFLLPGGFLRRDKGPGLFISDFPRLGEVPAKAAEAALQAAGFRASLSGGLARIDGVLEKYRALDEATPLLAPPAQEDTLPLYALGLHIARTGGAVTAESLPLLRLTLKALDGEPLPRLYPLLAPAVALCQREKIPLPAAAGKWMLLRLGLGHL